MSGLPKFEMDCAEDGAVSVTLDRVDDYLPISIRVHGAVAWLTLDEAVALRDALKFAVKVARDIEVVDE